MTGINSGKSVTKKVAIGSVGQVVLSLFSASWRVQEIEIWRVENSRGQSSGQIQFAKRRSLLSKVENHLKGLVDCHKAILITDVKVVLIGSKRRISRIVGQDRRGVGSG